MTSQASTKVPTQSFTPNFKVLHVVEKWPVIFPDPMEYAGHYCIVSITEKGQHDLSLFGLFNNDVPRPWRFHPGLDSEVFNGLDRVQFLLIE